MSARDRASRAEPLVGSAATLWQRFYFVSWTGLNFLDVFRLRSLGPLLGLELDFVSFGQRPEAAADDRAVMNEDVFASVIGGDETESFGIIEPLYRSLHGALLTQQMILRALSTAQAIARKVKR